MCPADANLGLYTNIHDSWFRVNIETQLNIEIFSCMLGSCLQTPPCSRCLVCPVPCLASIFQFSALCLASLGDSYCRSNKKISLCAFAIIKNYILTFMSSCIPCILYCALPFFFLRHLCREITNSFPKASSNLKDFGQPKRHREVAKGTINLF